MKTNQDYTFVCKKCGMEVTVSAPELTDTQKEKLHVCSDVRSKVYSGEKIKVRKVKK